MPVRVGPPLPNFPDALGVYANGQSGLVFNQSPEWLCGFESRHPRPRPFHVGRSSTGRALHCECRTLRVRIPPADLSSTRGVSQAGQRRATLYRVRAGSNPARPAKFYGAVAERLGTGLSIRTTRVRVPSVPLHARRKLKRMSACLLNRKVRVRVPRGASTFGV